jgi:mRNA interferase MazF
VCPITSRVKGYPFEVALPRSAEVTGVVLADQLKSVDWQQRRGERLGKVSEQLMTEVLDRLGPLLGF